MRSLLFLLLIALLVPNVKAQENASSVQAEPKAESSQSQNTAESIAKLANQNKKQPNSKSEEERADRDLAAQEEMAIWARRTFYGSLAGIFVSAIGLIAIVYSLRLNDDATRAAQAAVRIAEASNEIQSRAWISATCGLENVHHAKTHLGVDGTYANVVCRIKNHGNSPAVLIRFNAEAIVMHSENPEVALTKFAARHQVVANEALFSLFPGETTDLSHYIFFPADNVKDKTDANKYIHPSIVGVVTYKTANSPQTRQTGVYYHIVSPGENGTAMVVIPTDTFHLPTTMALAGPPIITAT